MPLTAKQQRFVVEYLVDGNGTQAAVRAGYSAKTAKAIAAENLTKPDIQAALAEARKPLEQATILNAVQRRERLSQISHSDNESAAIKAIDTLNRMDGLYVEKHEHKVTRADLSKLTDAELATLERLVAKAAVEGTEAVH